jgi:hypothetical protein
MTKKSEFDSQRRNTFFSLPPPNRYQELFPMGLEYGNGHSYPSNVEVTNALPRVCRVGYLINYRDTLQSDTALFE